MTALKILIASAALAIAACAPAAYAQVAQTAQVAPAQGSQASDAATADLTISFPDLASHQGTVMIVVYDNALAWKGGKPVRATLASASDATPSARIAGLPPGTYAVRAFQDIDGDGRLGTNPFGLPTEPFGFSNAAKPNMGPPSFEAAAFALKAGANVQSIQLK